MHALKILALGVTLAAAGGLGTGAMAAGTAAKPAAKKVAAAPALYCQLDKSGSNVTVQVVNSGKTDAAKGTVFAFTVLGPHQHVRARYTLPWALGAHQALNVTKPMPAAAVTSCRPAKA